MYKLLLSILVLALLGVAFAELLVEKTRMESVPTEGEASQLFSKFKVTFNKVYESAEEDAKRFEYFKNELKKIVERNLNSETATFGIFRFADLSPEEREQRRKTGLVVSEETLAMRALHANKTSTVNPINPIDWRVATSSNIQMATPVKDQGGCGSCYIFGAVEMVETAWVQAGHGLNILSPQQFMDCLNVGGCNGGDPGDCINKLVQYMGGALDFADSYPYILNSPHVQDQCYATGYIGGYVKAQHQVFDEDSIYYRVQKGPVTIAIDDDSLQSYSSGYLTASDCQSADSNHILQTVGVIYYSDGTPVWIIKNNWGTGWGQQGYAYVEYGQGACGVNVQGYWADPLF